MKNISFILLILLFISPITYVSAQAKNPFLNSSKPIDKKSESSQTLKTANKTKNTKMLIPLPIWMSNTYGQLQDWQKELNSSIANTIEKIKQGSKTALFAIFLIAFIYGIAHALGPGHGKSIVIGYFLNRDASWAKGASLGFFIASIHTLSAIITITFLYFIIKQAIMASLDSATQYIQLISFSIIILVGLFLIWHTLTEILQSKRSKQGQTSPDENKTSSKNIWSLALAIGIIPCPGASMILLFAYNLELYTTGILATIFMSVGMALTISIFTFIAIFFRQSLTYFNNKKKYMFRVIWAVEILTAFFIITLGAVLLSGTLENL